jgi:hypothetical protein
MLAHAASVPMLDGIGTAALRNDFGGTVGFEFKTGTNDIQVSALGFIDPEGDGLLGTHQVGIWLPNNPLPLALATIDPVTATANGLYWYANLDLPVVLSANSVYWIGAEVFNGGDYWMNAGADITNNPGFMQPTFAGFSYDTDPASAAGLYRAGGFGIPNGRQGGTNDVIFTAANLLGAIPSVPIAPTLLSQPQDANRLQGDSVIFQVLAFGSSPLHYQWQKNAADLSGATNSSLTLTNLQVADAGGYAVVLNNPGGSITSVVAQLTVTNPPVDITSGMVLHLALDDGHGLVAADSTTNHHNGTLQGFPDGDAEWVTGRINGAVNFNPVEAAGEVILVTDDGTLDFSASLNFSLAVWANGAAAQVDGAGILAKGEGNGGEQYALDVFAGNFRFYGWVGDGSYYLVTAPVGPNGTWQHLAMVFSKSLNRLKFYVNGVEAASSVLPTAIIASPHEISIGSRQLGASDYNLNFNGKIDDVRVYNRVLTSQDVAELYSVAALVAPSIVKQPQGGVYYSCETAALTVTIDGSEPLSYQWKRDGLDIPGATQATLTLQNLTSAQAGLYSVAVSNKVGKALSDVATINIKPGTSGRLYGDVNATGNRNDFSGTVGSQWDVGSYTLTVTALGFEDRNRDGLNSDHQVGIWDTNGLLVASVTVPAGTNALLEGAWRYVTLSEPVVLSAHTAYWIGGEVFNQDGDGWSDSGGSTSAPFGLTCQADIGFAAYAVGAFAQPVNNGGGGTPLRWAPGNAQFTVSIPPTLNITSAGSQIILSWSPDLTGWTLESASALPGVTWAPVPGVINNSVTVNPAVTGTSFFRLRK